MIQQIISHTPTYVWALLAFLVYRGVLAAKDRQVPLSKMFIIPVAMLVMSLAGINGHGPLGAGVWAVWLSGMLATVAIIWTTGKGGIAVDRATGTVLQRGSWTPLALMVAIFVTKYTVAVLSAMHPELQRQMLFVVAVSGLFGVFNGVFIGRLLRCVAAYARQPAAALA
ncbi:hypothetical protein SAMN05428959_104336 [Duganella sp. CF517]|uniref:DUF6622 family protein n=1 Tax=Duganella sp. CF517 TaxID=1881038 RepID=UPI0008BEE6D2|nr:DUF6622 family protein [Duganella sp. CF517]SEO04154.1 hypothetical protein SAMN05428959_104336 [Duganella sp. CF517]